MNNNSHGIDALCQIGLKSKERFALFGVTPNLRTHAHKDLLLWCS